jgi:hypothetical protein
MGRNDKPTIGKSSLIRVGDVVYTDYPPIRIETFSPITPTKVATPVSLLGVTDTVLVDLSKLA